jgi:hypothetical protein
MPTFGHHADDTRAPEILVIDATTGAVDRRMYSGPWALPSLDFDAEGSRMLVAGAMNLDFWRQFGQWRQSEKQTPMPRKVADTLIILKEALAKGPVARGSPPLSPARGQPTDWGELVQIHDDRDVFQASSDQLPAIDIHSL